MEYGRVDFVEEVKEWEIDEYNDKKLNKSAKKAHIVRSEIEEIKMCQGFGITVAELNQWRMQQ